MTKTGAIELTSRRGVDLGFLSQRLTYGGLLEGLPTIALNERIIARVVQEEQDACDGWAPYLIPPTQTLIEYHDDRPYPFGEPAALPRILCVARFRSYRPARDTTMDYSQLSVIWFQEDFAFPIDAMVLDALRQLDWEQHAHDAEY
jgi:hypothetical protein